MKLLSSPSAPTPTVNAVLIKVPRAARVRSEPVAPRRSSAGMISHGIGATARFERVARWYRRALDAAGGVPDGGPVLPPDARCGTPRGRHRGTAAVWLPGPARIVVSVD